MSMTADQLREQLEDLEESSRAFAAEDAGFEDRVESIDPLFDRLEREPSRFVRSAIVTALSRMTHPEVYEHAVALLESDDPFLRNAAVSLLRSREPAGLDRLEQVYLAADCDVRKLVLDTLSAVHGEHAERVLLLGLEDPEVNVRIAAVEYLGDRLRPELKPRFEDLLVRESEPMLLAAALSALEQVGDTSSFAVVEQRFCGSEQFPAFLAEPLLRAMANWGPRSCLPRFFEEQTRLGTVGTGSFLDGLETLQHRFAFRVLEKELFDALCRLLDACPTAMHRFRLLRWLGCLSEQPGVVELLVGYLENDDALVRRGAAQGLCRLGTTEAMSALADRLALGHQELCETISVERASAAKSS